MSFVLEFDPRAIDELKQAYDWYEERVQGLGDRFMKSVDKKTNLIAVFPENYAIKKHQFREAAIDKFPYVIIFEFLRRKGAVRIVAVFHTKRNPLKKYRN